MLYEKYIKILENPEKTRYNSRIWFSILESGGAEGPLPGRERTDDIEQTASKDSQSGGCRRGAALPEHGAADCRNNTGY